MVNSHVCIRAIHVNMLIMVLQALVTGLDRTQQYRVVCGELDNSTRPDSGVDQCQAEDAETTVVLVTEELTTESADASVTERLEDTSQDDSNEMALPYSLIGVCAYPSRVPLIALCIRVCFLVTSLVYSCHR